MTPHNPNEARRPASLTGAAPTLACITNEVRIIAFRCIGKAPMVGYRVDEVFFVVWIDRAFTLYSH